jgi:hypothetical protein
LDLGRDRQLHKNSRNCEFSILLGLLGGFPKADRKQYVHSKEQKMKNLIAAAVLSICAIASIPSQAYAEVALNGWEKEGETLCSGNSYLYSYGPSDLCGGSTGYTLLTEHEGTTSSIMLSASRDHIFRGGTLRIFVSESASSAVAMVEIDPDRNIRVVGDRAIVSRYRPEVSRLVYSIEQDWDGFDLDRFADSWMSMRSRNSSLSGE